jgi:hypothetical protein
MAEIRIPNLTPGKRYRMVITTNSAINGAAVAAGSTSAPSIEFVVPTSPELLSTYTPTYTVTPYNWKHETIIAATTTPGTTIAKGSQQAQTTYTYNYNGSLSTPALRKATGLGGWSRTKDQLSYTFYTDVALTGLTDNLPLDVNISLFGPTFDGVYTVTGVTNGSFTVVNDAKVKQTFSKAITTTSKVRRAEKTDTTSNNGNISYTIPNKPAEDQTSPGVTTGPTKTYEDRTDHNVTVTLPQELENSGMLKWNNNIRDGVCDVPVFFYIKNGIYYGMDDQVLSATPLNIITMPQSMIKSAQNLRANIDGTRRDTARDYRFTIARYKPSGSIWTGYWLQRSQLFPTVAPNMNNVIFSKTAVLV